MNCIIFFCFIKCVSLPGYGNSATILNKTNLTFQIIVEKLIRLLELYKYNRAIWMGHSLGSFIVQHAALTRPEFVESAILVSSGTHFSDVAYCLFFTQP